MELIIHLNSSYVFLDMSFIHARGKRKDAKNAKRDKES